MLANLQRENGMHHGLPFLKANGTLVYQGTPYDTRYIPGSGALSWVSDVIDPQLMEKRQGIDELPAMWVSSDLVAAVNGGTSGESALLLVLTSLK